MSSIDIHVDEEELKNLFTCLGILAGYGEQVSIYATDEMVSFYSLHSSTVSFAELRYMIENEKEEKNTSRSKKTKINHIYNFSMDSALITQQLEILGYLVSRIEVKLEGEISVNESALALTISSDEFVTTFCLNGNVVEVTKLEAHCMKKGYASWTPSMQFIRQLLTMNAPRWEIQIPRKNNVNLKGMTNDEHQIFLLRHSDQEAKGKKQQAVIDTSYIKLFTQNIPSTETISIRIGADRPIECHYKNLTCFIAPIEDTED